MQATQQQSTNLGNSVLQASLRKTVRALEKQQAKFQKQAEEWGEHATVSGHSQEACGAGLAGVKGQLELVRALREVHTQEVRQELAQFEAVSPRYCSSYKCYYWMVLL